MTVSVSSKRVTSQPHQSARPSSAFPWNKAAALYVSLGGRLVDLVNHARPITDTTNPRASANGIGAEFDGSSGEKVEFASNARNGPTGALTLLVHFEADTLSNYTPLISKQGTTTTNCPFEFRVGSTATDSRFTVTRANGSGFRVYDGAATEKLSAGRKNQFAAVVFPDGLLTSAPTIYVFDGFGVGGFVPHATTNVAGTGTGNVTDTTNPVTIGNRSDSTVTRFDGLVYSAVILPVALSEANVYAAFLDMLRWQQVEQRKETLFWGITGGTSTFTYAGSGSLVFSGTASVDKIKDYPASGSLTFSGTAAVDTVKSFLASGDIVFSGAATTAYVLTGAATYPYTGSGSIAFSGDAVLAKTKAYLGDGSVVFAGAATTALVGVTFPAISRPESDVVGGQWLASTGSDKYAMIDEEVLDTGDYVYANATALVQRFKLAAVAAGASPSLAYVADSSTGNGIIVTLQEGTTDIASETRNPLPATPTSYTLTLTAPQIAAITDWTNLYLKIESV